MRKKDNNKTINKDSVNTKNYNKSTNKETKNKKMIVYINKGIRSSTGPGTRQQQNAGRQKTLFLEIKERNTVSKFLLYFALKFQGRSRYGPRTTG